MTDTTAAPEATVPAAALTALQTKIDTDAAAAAQAAADADAALQATRALAEAAEAQATELKKQIAAQADLIAALEAKKTAAETALEAVSKDANFSRASSKARFRIILDEARDKSEPNPVFVQVNGRGYQIRRSAQVDVPREVVSCLNDAVVGRAEPIIDERTGISAGVQYLPGRRFPFRELGQSRGDDGQLLPGFDELPS
jgi:hypothetical protein